jgi:sigma-B regulation protein RsbU (phosphoserine phosphatase)
MMPMTANSGLAPNIGREATSSFDLVAELTHAFAASRCVTKTLELAVQRISMALQAEGGAVFLLDDPPTTLTCIACCGPVSLTGRSLPVGEGIIGRSIRTRRGEVIGNVSLDRDFFRGVDDATGFHTRSLLCSPIIIHGQCLGAIELVNPLGARSHFAPEDLQVLEVLATATGLALLGARSTERLIQQERMSKELDLAALIQKSMLPQPRAENFPVHGVSIPARVVSGDFYDIVALDDGRIGFNIGDVAGKGFRSALLMAKTASLYRCLLRSVRQPADLLRLINRELCETSAYGLFVTMIAGLYDPATGLLRLANAGHVPALVRDAKGGMTLINASMPPLGVDTKLAASPTAEHSFYLDGGTLYLCTDGVTEGRLPSGEPLEMEGFERHLQATSGLPVSAQLQTVLDRLTAAHEELSDDATLLAVDDRCAAAGRQSGDRARMDAPQPADGELLVEVAIAAQPNRLRLLRQVVSEAATTCGFDRDHAAEIVLAVDEACQNIIRHGYQGEPGGRIVLRLHRCSDRLVVLLRDFAEPVDVRKVCPRALDDIRCGGLGTHLMRTIMDEVAFEPPPEGRGNVLRLVKRIA